MDRLRLAFEKCCGARPDASHSGLGSGAFARAVSHLGGGGGGGSGSGGGVPGTSHTDADLIFIKACLRTSAGHCLGTPAAGHEKNDEEKGAGAGPSSSSSSLPSPAMCGDPAFRCRSLDLFGFADALLLLAEGVTSAAAASSLSSSSSAGGCGGAPRSPSKVSPNKWAASKKPGPSHGYFAAGLDPAHDKRAVLEAAAAALMLLR